MRTAFTLTQLADPAIAEADRILRACVHCGFCTATCPTYVLLGDELDSPRGRIYLIKDMLEDGRPATAEVVKHLDRCLSCLSCMTTCPSGVHYMHLIDHARSHVEKTYRRPLAERAWRALLAQVLPRRGLLRLALLMGVLGKPLVPLLRRLRLDRLAALLRLASPPAAASAGGRRVVPAQGSRRGRVALLSGCVNAVMAPQINEAAIGVLTRHGIEVVLAGEGCCGALVHHMGRDEDAAANARANVEVWNRELEAEGLDAILITASGCGTMVKDYGYLLRSDPGYADRAARISALTMDVCAYLSRLDLVPRRRTGLTVAYHAACSLQHGQRVIREPKALLAAAGFIVKDVPEGHLCCGSAGVYNILQPALADRLLDRKIANIQTLGCDLVAAGNIGCIAQIGSVHDKPVVHTVALIDWATGGPPPPGLDDRA